ncbi:acetyl-CoA carboxylase biotin carboxyl carrier protein subunit, partial [Streptomyces bambusae]|nr:acetyl-CoA carboxylase biotin carboxyl carrier protein subunit [Streptomyces bambusae]
MTTRTMRAALPAVLLSLACLGGAATQPYAAPGAPAPPAAPGPAPAAGVA